jgi:hypothetical protein
MKINSLTKLKNLGGSRGEAANLLAFPGREAAKTNKLEAAL